MRKPHRNRREHGFTLIELMVVILIIILLSAITIGALPGIQNKINRGRVEAFLAELGAGLDRYEIDNGMFPVNEPTGSDLQGREETGVRGAAILYQHLSGDYDMDGELFEPNGDRDPGDEDLKIYVEKLDGKYNENAKDKRSIGDPNGVGYILIDSYTSPIRYLAEKPNKKDKLTKNPTYDIWSIVDTDPSNASDFKTQSKYITNWTRN